VATYHKVESLSRYSQILYTDEKSRCAQIIHRLGAALKSGIVGVTVPKCTADGVIPWFSQSVSSVDPISIGIIEVKNEIGTGKSDPSIQGAVAYAIHWSQEVVCSNNASRMSFLRHGSGFCS
jgi:hypothetical protein